MSEINHEKPEFVPITSGEQLIQIANEMKQYANDNPIDMEVIAQKTRDMLASGKMKRIPELWPYSRYIEVGGKPIQLTLTNDRKLVLQLSASVVCEVDADEQIEQKHIQAIHEAFWSNDNLVGCKQMAPKMYVWMRRLGG